MSAPIEPNSLDAFIGPAAGVATSFLWVLTSICFTSAGKRIGSTAVNTLRLIVAVAIHAITFRLVDGAWWPEATGAQIAYLAASGIVGLTICDQALFTAFVDIGPRRALLVMTTTPIFAVAFGWVFVGEAISWRALLGIAVTVAGVAWVVSERSHTKTDDQPHPHVKRGYILAVIAAATQAGGLLLSKLGMGHGVVAEEQLLDPQPATYVRMIFGLLGMLPIVLVYAAGRNRPHHHAARARRIGSRPVGYTLTVMGAVVGPYLGVWMSLVAADRSPLGVAMTLCSLAPVMILPFAVLVYRERVSPRAAIGAMIAVAGSVFLFLYSGG